MRIHLNLEPSLFAPQAAAGPSTGPLAQLGGEVVLIELQGELGWEGDKDGGVVGVIGLERPDKPTLHLGQHHLLHGKFVNLPKPLAVIRRAVASAADGDIEGAVQGDAEEEEAGDSDVDEGIRLAKSTTLGAETSRGAGKRKGSANKEDQEEDEGPLFPPGALATPPRRGHPASSSPFPLDPPSSVKDYSSELDFSSPPGSLGKRQRDEDDDEDEEDEEDDVTRAALKEKERRAERRRQERKASRPERTRVYEVVSVVRRKVVFALRPEPIVTATQLPD